MGGGPIVAEREAASSDDRFPAGDADDRDRAGTGVHQPAVRAGMGADAGGRCVVCRAHQPIARKRLDDPRLVARVAEAGKPEADRDARVVGAIEPRLAQNFVDDAAQHGDGGGEIDVDIRRRAARLG